MQEAPIEVLKAWQNFYMLAGGASTSLMGLVFIAATLAARLVDADTATVGARAFVTPILIHFSAVLVIAMLVMIPTHTSASLGCYLGLGGVAGLAYACTTGVQLWRHHQRRARLARADWLWLVCLPTLSYLLILSAACGLLARTTQLLHGLALAVIILLLLGVRNAWDLLLWINRQRLHTR